MLPLIVLALGTLLFAAAGWVLEAFEGISGALAGGLALMFLLTASAHFVGARRNELVAMVPPRLPRRSELVAITGIAELLGAVLLLVPASRVVAAVALALMVIAMTPANVYAARAGLELGGKPVTPVVPRLIIQVLFVGALAVVAVGS